MDTLVDDIFENVTNTIHLVQFIDLRIQYFNDRRNYDLAIHTARVFLGKIGDNIEMDWFSSIACDEFNKIKGLVYGKSDEDVLSIKRADDQKIIAIMMILSRIISSAFFSQVNLLFPICCKYIQYTWFIHFAFLTFYHEPVQIVKLTFEFGISKYSSVGFVSLATLLCGEKETALGYRFATLALELLKTVQSKEIIPIVQNTFYTMVYHFHASIHDVFHPLLKVYKTSRKFQKAIFA